MRRIRRIFPRFSAATDTTTTVLKILLRRTEQQPSPPVENGPLDLAFRLPSNGSQAAPVMESIPSIGNQRSTIGFARILRIPTQQERKEGDAPMKIHCQRPALATAFLTVAAIVPSKTTKPVLLFTRIEAYNGTVTLLGSDGESSIRYMLPDAVVEIEGTVLVPTVRTAIILKELQGETVVIETLDNNVRVTSGRADYKLGYQNPELFPTIADFEEENYHTIDAGLLRQLIRRTIFAADTESSRYALGGVLVEFGPDRVTMAATDTRRLSVATGRCVMNGVPRDSKEPPVVPQRAMHLIERSLTDDTSQVQLAIRANDMLMRGGFATIYSRLVEGRFPRYQDVIPKRLPFQIDLPVEPFAAVVRQSQIVTSEDSRGVEFRFEDGLLTLTSEAANIGESKVDMPTSYDGPPLSFSLDPKFVSDFLRVLDSGSVVHLEALDGENAVVLRTDDGSIYVVMPLSRDR